MGGFFENVQVFTDGRAAEKLAASLAGVLTKLLRPRGWLECEAEDSERELAIRAAGRWISVYDSETESQNSDALRQLASDLSMAAEAPAVSVLVHDSDILELRLYRGGREEDWFNSRPDYFEDVEREVLERSAGQPSAWVPLLSEGRSLPELEKAFVRTRPPTPPVPAEDKLDEVSSVLGWDAGVYTGLVDVEERAEEEQVRVLSLHFKRAVRPRGAAARTRTQAPPASRDLNDSGDVEAPGLRGVMAEHLVLNPHLVEDVRAGTAPELPRILPGVTAFPAGKELLAFMNAGRSVVEARVGETAFHLIGHNAGMASSGLHLRVHGPAVEQGLVVPQEVWISGAATLHLPLRQLGKSFVAELPDFTLPKMDRKSFSEAFKSCLNVEVRTQTRARGEALLFIELIPVGNPIRGRFIAQRHVHVE